MTPLERHLCGRGSRWTRYAAAKALVRLDARDEAARQALGRLEELACRLGGRLRNRRPTPLPAKAVVVAGRRP